MSLLRGLPRTYTWTSSNYVCLSCRHKLQASRRQFIRGRSDVSRSEIESGGVDEWSTNFNDLSAYLPSRKGKVVATASPDLSTVNTEYHANNESADAAPRDRAAFSRRDRLRALESSQRKSGRSARKPAGEEGRGDAGGGRADAVHAAPTSVNPSARLEAYKARISTLSARELSERLAKRRQSAVGNAQQVASRNRTARRRRKRDLLLIEALKARSESAPANVPEHANATNIDPPALLDSRAQYEATLERLSKTIGEQLKKAMQGAQRASQQSAIVADSDSAARPKPNAQLSQSSQQSSQQSASGDLSMPAFDPTSSLTFRPFAKPSAASSAKHELDTFDDRRLKRLANMSSPAFGTTVEVPQTQTMTNPDVKANEPASLGQKVREAKERPKWGGAVRRIGGTELGTKRLVSARSGFLDKARVAKDTTSSRAQSPAVKSAQQQTHEVTSTEATTRPHNVETASMQSSSAQGNDEPAASLASAQDHLQSKKPGLFQGMVQLKNRLFTELGLKDEGGQQHQESDPIVAERAGQQDVHDNASNGTTTSPEIPVGGLSVPAETTAPDSLSRSADSFDPVPRIFRKVEDQTSPTFYKQLSPKQASAMRLFLAKGAKTSNASLKIRQPVNVTTNAMFLAKRLHIPQPSKLELDKLVQALEVYRSDGTYSHVVDALSDMIVARNEQSSALVHSTAEQASANALDISENAASDNESIPTSGGGTGGDDYDGGDRPLWQVMQNAKALEPDEPVSEVPAEEQTESVDDTPLDLSDPVGSTDVLTIAPAQLVINALNIPQPAVPGLEYGLDRVLFNPGVYQLQDPHSRVYNFDPYLQKIMPVTEFDFNALKEYKTSSKDTALSDLAQEYGKRYIGSTSSMTGMLAHFHYLLSDWRPLNLTMLSRGFSDNLDTFTQINRAPNAIFLRWKNGTYAIDADKEYDSGNVLMLLGKSMEKLLTLSKSDYERYRKSDPRTISEEEREAPEAFEYTTMGDFLMRSQLDAYDPRLPGNGMFDLKTRAVLSVRMSTEDFEPMTGYEIHTLQGRFGSYEREVYDMMRSTMLKYMLQARMGRMDGIFIAYHNVERIFGFQYVPIQEMDRAIHGQVERGLGDQEFKTSLDLVNKIFDKATAKYPGQSLRFHFETTTEQLGGSATTVMWIFGEPMAEEEIERIQALPKERIAEFERTTMGVEKEEPVASSAIDQAASAETDEAASDPPVEGSKEGALNSSENSESSDYTTSRSNGDSQFLESVANDSPPPKGNLFAASLICKSRVNGVPTPRPENLKPADVWEVEYLLREWDAPDAMWAKYSQMKMRKKELMDKLRGEDDVPEEQEEMTSKQKRNKSYIEFLKSLSASGREYRTKLDRLEAGKEPTVVGQRLPSSQSLVEEKVGNVGEYMAWLYGREK